MPKYARYQDYVIRDGRLVGEFEQMYRDFDEPWDQSRREEWASEKAVAVNWCRRILAERGRCRVLELGCGLGHFTAQLAGAGLEVTGVDISGTAVAKARERHPHCTFEVADVLEIGRFAAQRIDAVVMAEITWYVLDKLDRLLALLRQEFAGAHLIHLLTVYPPGVQKYGTDYFTTPDEIMAYFGCRYREWGVLHNEEHDGCGRSWFVARL